MSGGVGLRRHGIATRLIAAMAVVILVGGLTAVAVAVVVGPIVLDRHLLQMQTEPGTAMEHATLALRSASTWTLVVAVAASLVTSLVTGLVLARRIAASLGTMSRAAANVAAGRFDARVPRPGVGVEFDELADSFNEMAGRLDDAQVLRRRLLADVAHELRTPVATISATMDAVQDGVLDLSPQTVAVLRAQNSRLARLAEDLASVTHAESGALHLRLRPVAPQSLVDRAGAAAQEAFVAAGVAFEAGAAPDLPEVRVDPDRIGQVLGNLLDNALRHTPPGGRVTLSAGPADGGVHLTVTDTGDGIDAVHLPRVFERFYRVDDARDRARGGSGIGLSITRALVHAHGGTITAHSAGLGQGAQFVVTLPANPA